jgi:hypothetical protein
MEKTYVSKTPNTCKLKLHIPLEIVNNILSHLKDSNEIAGVLYCDKDDNVINNDKNEGDKDSVYTPNNVINYHTHPISCYVDAKTSFGSPSGEDYRETVKFALAGNKAHIVFTVEGLYIIQLSPCKIKKIKEHLDDRQRGILIFLIEEYFKMTHNLRCVPELNRLSKRNIHLNAYSFADFASTFDLKNLLSDSYREYKEPHVVKLSETGHTGIHSEEKDNITRYAGTKDHSFCKIPNLGFPQIEGNYFTTSTLKESIDNLEDLRYISKDGEESSPTQKESVTSVLREFNNIISILDVHPCDTLWNNKPNSWFFVNFFPTEYYKKQMYYKGVYVPPVQKDIEFIRLTQEPFIRIFSDTGSGCSVNEIAKKHKFKFYFSKGNNFSVQKKVKYSFGKKKKPNMLYQLNKDICFLKRKV